MLRKKLCCLLTALCVFSLFVSSISFSAFAAEESSSPDLTGFSELSSLCNMQMQPSYAILGDSGLEGWLKLKYVNMNLCRAPGQAAGGQFRSVYEGVPMRFSWHLQKGTSYVFNKGESYHFRGFRFQSYCYYNTPSNDGIYFNPSFIDSSGDMDLTEDGVYTGARCKVYDSADHAEEITLRVEFHAIDKAQGIYDCDFYTDALPFDTFRLDLDLLFWGAAAYPPSPTLQQWNAQGTTIMFMFKSLTDSGHYYKLMTDAERDQNLSVGGSGGGSGSSGGDTTVNVDMTETNGLLGGVKDILSSIGTSISNLAHDISESVISGISSIFVPEEGYLDEKFLAIKEKFSFFEGVRTTVEQLKVSMESYSDNDAPAVTVDLGNATSSKFNGGGVVTVLDLSFLSPYRSRIRGILSAFLWLFFIWRVYVHLPRIISGSGGDVGFTSLLEGEGEIRRNKKW